MVMELGEIRRQLTDDLAVNVDRAINECPRRKFYILIYARVEGTLIKNKIILLSQRPLPLLGTILLHVDKHKGIMKRIWVLPRDVPLGGVQLIGEPVEMVAKDIEASGIPLINS